MDRVDEVLEADKSIPDYYGNTGLYLKFSNEQE
jgi:hypothetical protein